MNNHVNIPHDLLHHKQSNPLVTSPHCSILAILACDTTFPHVPSFGTMRTLPNAAKGIATTCVPPVHKFDKNNWYIAMCYVCLNRTLCNCGKTLPCFRALVKCVPLYCFLKSSDSMMVTWNELHKHFASTLNDFLSYGCCCDDDCCKKKIGHINIKIHYFVQIAVYCCSC